MDVFDLEFVDQGKHLQGCNLQGVYPGSIHPWHQKSFHSAAFDQVIQQLDECLSIHRGMLVFGFEFFQAQSLGQYLVHRIK